MRKKIAMNKLELFLSFLNESENLIDNLWKNVIYKNLDSWEPGKILFITGPQGSGKTTLAEKLNQKIDNCEIFFLDTFKILFNNDNEKISKKFNYFFLLINKFKNEENIKDRIENYKDEIFYLEKFIYWVPKRLEKNIFYIFEGCQLLNLKNKELLINSPIIIIKSVFVISLFRVLKRILKQDKKTKQEKIERIKFLLKNKNIIKNSIKDTNELKNLISEGSYEVWVATQKQQRERREQMKISEKLISDSLERANKKRKLTREEKINLIKKLKKGN